MPTFDDYIISDFHQENNTKFYNIECDDLYSIFSSFFHILQKKGFKVFVDTTNSTFIIAIDFTQTATSSNTTMNSEQTAISAEVPMDSEQAITLTNE